MGNDHEQDHDLDTGGEMGVKRWMVVVCLLAGMAQGAYWNEPVPIPEVADRDKICFALYTV